MEIVDFLRYGFIQRAVVAGVFISVVCATLGVLLVLRRLSLIGDGLAHVTFGSVAFGLVLNTHPLYVSIPAVMASSLGILKLMERTRIYGDAAIGVISAVGIAGGVVLASLGGGFNIDLFSYLFGSILSIGKGEVVISVALCAAVLLTISFFYHDLFSVTFDEEYARASGINARRMNVILILTTALTVVLAMKVAGIMLTSALLVLPAVTAIQLAGSFRGTIITASFIAVTSVLSGIAISITLDLPTGAAIVMVNLAMLSAVLCVKAVVHAARGH
ncbi:MAG: metal ABC transporter permease [Chloroflexota bacterium]